MSASDGRRSAMVYAVVLGTALQLAMVLTGHWVASVANLFGVLGVAISLVAGFVYGLRAPGLDAWAALGGGALAGALCAFLGIVVSWVLGDVTAMILAVGTASSAVTGAVGGLAGRAMRSGPSTTGEVGRAG